MENNERVTLESTVARIKKSINLGMIQALNANTSESKQYTDLAKRLIDCVNDLLTDEKVIELVNLIDIVEYQVTKVNQCH